MWRARASLGKPSRVAIQSKDTVSTVGFVYIALEEEFLLLTWILNYRLLHSFHRLHLSLRHLHLCLHLLFSSPDEVAQAHRWEWGQLLRRGEERLLTDLKETGYKDKGTRRVDFSLFLMIWMDRLSRRQAAQTEADGCRKIDSKVYSTKRRKRNQG
jgi:hypothetical protein